jgi:Zn-dependent M28 family amino/carboxypeptidase
MDNAIGVATLIEVARELKAKPLKRSVAFAAVTAEEKGLLGSRHLAHQPSLRSMKMVGNINLDMYLPLYPLKIMRVLGLDESTMGALVKETAAARKIEVQGDLQPDRNSFVRSDQYSFIKQGIPAVNLGFGAPPDSPEAKVRAEWLKERYHAPSDDLQQPVDKEAAIEFNHLLVDLIERTANAHESPRWLESSFFKRFAR